MKFICLGYIEESLVASMSEKDMEAFMDRCFEYDDELRKNGHFVGGEALQGPRTGATLRVQDGEVTVTDGPFAETKEYLGGIMILEADNFDHAVELMSKHPGVFSGGCFEVRPAADLCAFMEASRQRREVRG